MENEKHYDVGGYPVTGQEQSIEERRAWIDKVFAPLLDFLAANYPNEKDQIIPRLMFMGHGGEGDTNFYYKNSLSREYIVISASGSVVRLDTGAFL